MTGGVRKRGSTWSYYFDLGLIGGKRKRKEKGGYKTKKDAQQALNRAINNYNQTGKTFDESEMTLSDYLDQWYRLYCIPNIRYNTLRDYQSAIRTRIKPELGHYKLKMLTPAILQEYANSLKKEGYSRNYVNGILMILRSALNYAVEPLHYIPINPMHMIRFPRIERPPKTRMVLNREQWELIITRMKDTKYYTILMIGFYTGLRIGEAAALTWDDIDFGNETLTVNKQLTKRRLDSGNWDWYVSPPKTSSSKRTILIGNKLIDALREEKDRQEVNAFKVPYRLKEEHDEKGNTIYHLIQAKGKNPIKLINLDQKGYLVSPDSLKYCSRVIRNELHIKEWDYHCLRHTHATRLIESGAPIKDVQYRLGHANIQTTLQTYTHVTKKMSIQSVEIFEKWVADEFTN